MTRGTVKSTRSTTADQQTHSRDTQSALRKVHVSCRDDQDDVQAPEPRQNAGLARIAGAPIVGHRLKWLVCVSSCARSDQ